MAARRTEINGSGLRVGDLVEWYVDGRTVKVTDLRPYLGPLAYLFPEGAQIAEFAGQCPAGSTIDNSRPYVVLR